MQRKVNFNVNMERERERERERDVVHVGSVHLFIYYVVYSGKFSNASLIEILCI
jgi:hypothetical protein